MLVMSKGALTAAQAETYYEEKYSQDDYYTEKQRVVGNWFGRGAEELGLSGEVATEDFRAVLRGLRHAKVTAAPPLTRNSGGACSTGTARHRLRRTLRLSLRAAFRKRVSESSALPQSQLKGARL